MHGGVAAMDTLLFIAAIWLVYLAAVSSTAVAVDGSPASRLTAAVASGGVVLASAASLLVIAWTR
jgi:hypothetical protein